MKDAVQQKYGQAAFKARSGYKASCGCGSASCDAYPITSHLYDESQAAATPSKGKWLSRVQKERYAKRETALMFPIVQE